MNKEQLKQEIKRLKVFCFSEQSFFKCKISHNSKYYFYKLLKAYYKYRFHKSVLPKLFWYRVYSNYSIKLNVQINCSTTLFGLRLMHQNVVIHKDANIGKNLSCAGNNCVGGTAKGAPRIGDNCKLGFGAIVLGNVTIADDCYIGAGAIVTKDIKEKGTKVVGLNKTL